MVSHDSAVAPGQRTGLMSNGRLTIQARPANTLPWPRHQRPAWGQPAARDRRQRQAAAKGAST